MTDTLIPRQVFMAFMDLTALVETRDQKEAIANLLETVTDAAHLQNWVELCRVMHQVGHDKGYAAGCAAADAAQSEATEMYVPQAPDMVGRYTVKEAALLRTWRSARGARMPDVVREDIKARLRKHEPAAAIQRRYGVAYETVAKIRDEVAEEAVAEGRVKVIAKDAPGNDADSATMPDWAINPAS